MEYRSLRNNWLKRRCSIMTFSTYLHYFYVSNCFYLELLVSLSRPLVGVCRHLKHRGRYDRKEAIAAPTRNLGATSSHCTFPQSRGLRNACAGRTVSASLWGHLFHHRHVWRQVPPRFCRAIIHLVDNRSVLQRLKPVSFLSLKYRVCVS